MQSFKIGENEAGQRLDKYLLKLMPQASKSFIYKMLRKKNILLNDKKAQGSERTCVGDTVKLYLSDATIEQLRNLRIDAQGAALQINPKEKVDLDIIYEDEHVLLVNKPQGILSQKSKPTDVSMVELITYHLMQSGRISAEELKTFHPAVVNRLDRNTSGILCAGVSLPGLQQFSALFKERSMKKEYICLVKGSVKKELTLKGYLLKNHKTNQVQVFESKPLGQDASYIETAFMPLAFNDKYSLLCVDLITGRSHQIRAHLASIGYPIVGDEKYGDPRINKQMREKYGITAQCLHAWRMTFPALSGALLGLSKAKFSADLPENFKKVIKGEGFNWQPGQEEV